MLQVTSNDITLEQQVLDMVKDTDLFRDLIFFHNRPDSVYDFAGFLKTMPVCEVDIKVREESSFSFPNYFVSKEKVGWMRGHPRLDYYIVYFFNGDKKIRIYQLNSLDLKSRMLNFKHKRSGRNLTSMVFLVPAQEFAAEYYYF